MAYITSSPLPYSTQISGAGSALTSALNIRSERDEGTFQELRAVLSKAAQPFVSAYTYARVVTPNGSSYATFLATLAENECFVVTDDSDFDGGQLATTRNGYYGSATLTGDELYQKISGNVVIRSQSLSAITGTVSAAAASYVD